MQWEKWNINYSNCKCFGINQRCSLNSVSAHEQNSHECSEIFIIVISVGGDIFLFRLKQFGINLCCFSLVTARVKNCRTFLINSVCFSSRLLVLAVILEINLLTPHWMLHDGSTILYRKIENEVWVGKTPEQKCVWCLSQHSVEKSRKKNVILAEPVYRRFQNKGNKYYTEHSR